jgi:hypothetical protein
MDLDQIFSILLHADHIVLLRVTSLSIKGHCRRAVKNFVLKSCQEHENLS